MQSSPPNRAWHGPPSSTGSHYSLNLDALDQDDKYDSSDDIIKPKVERIFSEDIEGPSDFTENMGHWLRGKHLRKVSTNAPRKPPINSVLEDSKVEHLGESQRASVDATNDEDVEVEYTQAISHHTPAGTPPRVSILQQSKSTEDPSSSEFVPHAVASTPFPPPHQQTLQPSVEDYYSELTPARLAPRHPRISHSFQSPMSEVGADLQLKERRDSSPSVRAGVKSPRQSSQAEDVANHHDDQKRWMQDLQDKCEQLEKYNAAIQQALHQEKKIRSQESLVHESRMDEARQRMQELTKVQEGTLQRNVELQHANDNLCSQLAKKRKQESSSESDAPRPDQEALLDQLQDRIAHQASEHEEQIKALEQTLTVAQNSRRDAEEMARVYKEELEELQEKHEADIGRLAQESLQSRESKTATIELEESLRVANVHISQLQAVNRAAQLDLKTTQIQLQSVRTTDDAILSRITSERFRAVELASSLQEQLHGFRQQVHESSEEHEAELSRLRSVHAEQSNVSQQELDVLRKELHTKITELNEVILDRDEAQDARQKCQAELDAANAKLEHTEAVNAEMDDRVATSLRQREQHWRGKEQKWRRKLEEVDHERQIMAKALLHQWGRDEVGIQEPQLYAYRYTKSSSPTRSSSVKKTEHTVVKV